MAECAGHRSVMNDVDHFSFRSVCLPIIWLTAEVGQDVLNPGVVLEPVQGQVFAVASAIKSSVRRQRCLRRRRGRAILPGVLSLAKVTDPNK